TMQHLLQKITKVLVDVPASSHVQVNVPLTTESTVSTTGVATTASDQTDKETSDTQSGTTDIAGYGVDTDANSY
ncbi:MAG: hypothetical protein ACK4PR_04355, partial [Gammaproteobacteria bacterium]